MSDIREAINGGRYAANRVCRVSYILNNSQPVRSTIIGDQPLFYMDFGCGIEDEDDSLFAAADYGVLESEIENLKKEIQAFEKHADKFVQPKSSQDREAFEADKKILPAPMNFAPEKNGLQNITSALCESRMGKAYVEFAAKHGVEIMYSGQVEDASYERKAKKIFINPIFGSADQILIAARELRRHWQHRQGALIHPLLFHPDNAVLVNRAQSADLSVSMVRIAWELQLAGKKECWERIENSSLADLGRALAREAFLDFRTLNSGQASAAVFEAWFLSERCRLEDKKLIKQMLADYQGYVFEGEEGQQALTPALICALGAMPFGKNYLAPHAATILADSVFTEVRDRSNANFLWFIKFERSFRETEQELQTTKEPTSAKGVRPKGAKPQDKSYENAEQASAEIVQIFPERESGDKEAANGKILPPKSSVKRTKRKNKKSPSAQIVYLRRWSGE